MYENAWLAGIIDEPVGRFNLRQNIGKFETSLNEARKKDMTIIQKSCQLQMTSY